jgi:glucuronosyltransferase
VLGIPIFGDQKMNMAKAVARGYGLQLYFEDITEKVLTDKLKELLENPKYDENAKVISSRFTDRPMTPQESVVYWTEYAVRHKGAPHLRAAGNSLSFIELNLIDVYAVMGLIIFVVLSFCLKILVNMCKVKPRQNQLRFKIKKP